MIKLFRTIRKDLMEKNKTGKYLKYAIGEIILVVIGILIALQINNRNEQNKIKQEEKILIAGLIQNIDTDIKNLTSLKESDSVFIVANKIILNAFKIDSIRNNKSLLALNIIQSSFTSSFNPTQIVFNQMQFSGKLNYVSNDLIKYRIQAYYDGVTEVMDIQESNLNVIYEIGTNASGSLDANSAFQFMLPEYAKIELDEFDNSFFHEPLQSDKVKVFSNMVTLRQVLMLPILRNHKSLLQNGIQLKQDLTKYLDSK